MVIYNYEDSGCSGTYTVDTVGLNICGAFGGNGGNSSFTITSVRLVSNL